MVANDTHKRYGILTIVTHFMCGEIANMSQTSVPKMISISIEARRLFFSPNWIGVKARLLSRFKANGNAMIHGSLPVATL